MIAKTFTDSFIEVQKLVRVFQANSAHYLSSKYQEAEVRQEFLDKFFVALGWDVYHHEKQK
jgi:adenine-specific DNA-methyltransferase